MSRSGIRGDGEQPVPVLIAGADEVGDEYSAATTLLAWCLDESAAGSARFTPTRSRERLVPPCWLVLDFRK